MSDAPPADAPAAPPAPAPDAPAEGEGEGTQPDPTALKKALDRERQARRDAEKRAKELAPYEAKAREAEEASKTETQKLNEALAAEKAGRSSAEMELTRYRVASEKGVPLNLVRFLTGATPEEIGESADLLLKELNTKPTMPARPQERTAVSNKPSDASDSEDPMALIKQARAGRLL